MKKTTRYLAMGLCICMFFLNLSQFIVFADNENNNGNNNSIIDIDGYFDDWASIPYSYHINYDDSGWPLPNDAEHKHTIAFHRDENNVYLYVKMLSQWTYPFNGNYYQFFLDGQMIALTITRPNGEDSSSLGEGRHKLVVRYVNNWNKKVKGSDAYLYRNADRKGDTVEIMIPLSGFSEENPNIDPNNIQTVEFFTPNLMYRRISCTGTSTAPYLGIGISAFVTLGGYLFYKNKRKKIS